MSVHILVFIRPRMKKQRSKDLFERSKSKLGWNQFYQDQQKSILSSMLLLIRNNPFLSLQEYHSRNEVRYTRAIYDSCESLNRNYLRLCFISLLSYLYWHLKSSVGTSAFDLWTSFIFPSKHILLYLLSLSFSLSSPPFPLSFPPPLFTKYRVHLYVPKAWAVSRRKANRKAVAKVSL